MQKTHDTNEAVLRNQGRISNVDDVQCCCGKKCKNFRGLKTHQRSCRFVRGMNNELLFEESEVNNLDDDLSVELDDLILGDTPGQAGCKISVKMNVNGGKRTCILERNYQYVM